MLRFLSCGWVGIAAGALRVDLLVSAIRLGVRGEYGRVCTAGFKGGSWLILEG